MIFGRQTASKVDVGQAYILWRLLVNRYVYVGHIQQLKNFSHDMDFITVLDRLIKDWRKEANLLSAELEKYGLRGAEPPAVNQSAPGNSEIVIDKETAEVVYMFMRLDVHIILWAFKDSYVNDELRKILLNIVDTTLERLDSYISYLKLKNWIEYPPYYPYMKEGLKDNIAVNEVYLLWDHLVFRYSNIRKTQLYAEMTTDSEFSLLLNEGAKTLQKQAKALEDKLLYFGIAMPKPYSDIRPNIKMELPIENKFLYADILRGMQEALALHGSAIQDVILNDDIRKFFKKLTMDELTLVDKFVKFGKIRGWLGLVPSFSQKS